MILLSYGLLFMLGNDSRWSNLLQLWQVFDALYQMLHEEGLLYPTEPFVIVDFS